MSGTDILAPCRSYAMSGCTELAVSCIGLRGAGDRRDRPRGLLLSLPVSYTHLRAHETEADL
eukprot:3584095-Rhodomonas_salina.4